LNAESDSQEAVRPRNFILVFFFCHRAPRQHENSSPGISGMHSHQRGMDTRNGLPAITNEVTFISQLEHPVARR